MARSPRLFVALTFATTHDALAAEAALKSVGLDVVPIPTPHGAKARCGIAMRIPPSQVAAAESALHEAGISPSGAVEIEDV